MILHRRKFKKEEKILWSFLIAGIIIVIILGAIVIGGFLNFLNNMDDKFGEVNDVCMYMSIDYDEVAEINYTYINVYYENKCDKVITYMDDDYEPKTKDYGVYIYGYKDLFGKGDISLSGWNYSNTKTAMIDIVYYPDSRHDSNDDISLLKERIIWIINELADIGNLTLNWEEATWTVNYTDY